MVPVDEGRSDRRGDTHHTVHAGEAELGKKQLQRALGIVEMHHGKNSLVAKNQWQEYFALV